MYKIIKGEFRKGKRVEGRAFFFFFFFFVCLFVCLFVVCFVATAGIRA